MKMPVEEIPRYTAVGGCATICQMSPERQLGGPGVNGGDGFVAIYPAAGN
jgi:hypothetical protein